MKTLLRLRRRYALDRAKLGRPAARALLLADLAARLRGKGGPGALRLAGCPHPLAFRRGTSDPRVIREVFAREAYRRLAGLPEVAFILDCGANIGCAAVYLLEKYPAARIIAVEPDAENAALCRANLAPYGARAEVLEAAVWPTRAPLRIRRGAFRDGREWAHQVAPAAAGEEAEVTGVPLGALLEKSPAGRIDLLKMDVERAEREIFSADCGPWLRRTRNLAVELHDAECRTVFFRAMAGFRYELETSGELTLCRNIRPAAG